jgi:hypothetical protein
MTLFEIEKLAKEYSDTRANLRDRVTHLEDEIMDLKKKYLPGIRRAVEAASEKQSKLKAAVEASPDFFQKPRTQTLYGIRFGFMKQKGKIGWEDDELVIKLIKKHFPDTYETYIKTVEKPLKAVLETLSVAELKKIGVEATESGDAVVIKPVDSEVDKLVDSLLKEDDLSKAQGLTKCTGVREAA